MGNWDVALIFVFVRLLSVLLVQTYFVADEYWQSLEVAHKVVFGYGYLTWEWAHGIRSYVHPLFVAFLYKTLQIFGLDKPELLIYLPRILQAFLSAYSDLCFYQWSGTKKWAVFSIVSSWFWFYTGSRTLINTFETCLTTIALSKFPWIGAKGSGNGAFLWIVAVLCYIRPTAAVQWLPLCFYHLFISETSFWKTILNQYLVKGLIVASFGIAVDSFSHGSLTITPLNFLKSNVFNNVGEWYGTQPWFWYLSTGFPAVLGIQLLPFIFAVVVILKNRHSHPNELALLGCVIFTITAYSFLSHKEFRFILPLLPICLYVSSRYLSAWSRKATTFSVWLVAIVIILGNALPACYLSFVHQRGTLDAVTPLRELAVKNPNSTSFLVLMPCHSTPLYSHLHTNVPIRFLTCEPNFNNTQTYVDEADKFYENPNYWLRTHFPPNGTLPSHIISFDVLIPRISDILSRYKPLYRIFHTSFPSDRIGKYVVIHERVDVKPAS